MGLGFSQDGQVQQLYQFRKLGGDQENFEIPERPENRTVTDRKYLIALITVIIVLFPFLIYTLMYVETRQLSGSDNCGNFCGYKNKKYDDWACTGQDYTDRLYQNFDGYSRIGEYVVRKRECVETCPADTEAFFHTCLPKHHTQNGDDVSMEYVMQYLGRIGRDIKHGWWAIVVSAIVSCLLCFGAMSLFRYAVDFVVWFILLGSIGILGILAGVCWYAYFHFKDDPQINVRKTKNGAQGFLVFAIILSIIVCFLIIVITCMIKRVKLIIQLFKEASKAIFDVPSMILIPIWVSFLISFVFVIFINLTVFMSLAGKLTDVGGGYLEYMQNGIMTTAIFYNIFVYIWVSEFILGSQYIIVAGAVSAWFFTRNKHYLSSPLWTSFTNFTRFHLGTVAIGSLIIAIMSIIRALIKSLSDNPRTKWIIECCLSNIEEFLRFLSKNAYIQTAMHGQPFFKSGKRAAKLLVSNAANVIAVNSIGDFVLAIAQLLLIVVCSIANGFIAKSTGVENYWAIALISFFISVCMAVTFFSIFQTTIDCIFICFCEDTTLNDGMARPYFMSKGLMQFIEDSKAIIPAK